MMEKTKHTPGPWWASKEQDTRGRHGWRIDSDSRALMAWAAWPSEGDRDSTEAESTARLIAASPELLDALNKLLIRAEYHLDRSATHDGLMNVDAIVAARAALAKARGK